MSGKITFAQPVADLISKRYSCRSFDGHGLEAATLAALERFPAALELPFASRLRFGVIDREKVRAENPFSTGSYGMIKGVRFYLTALAARDARRPWEDIGFALEATVLYATALELGSCWIGGIFDRRNFGKALAMGENEMLPAVIAVGRPAARPSLRDRLVRWGARGDLRKDPGELFFIGRLENAARRRNMAGLGAGPAGGSPGPVGVQQAALAHRPQRRRLPFFSRPRQGLWQADASRRPAAHRHGHRHVPFPAGGGGTRPGRRAGRSASPSCPRPRRIMNM